jgi:hypothetical protein
MIKILKNIINILTNFLNLFINFLKKIENFLNEDNLTLIRISRSTLGRNITFVLNNKKLLEKKDLFFQIYMFLKTNEDFLNFGEHKVIIVMGRVKNETFNLHHNLLLKNTTTFEEY